MLLSYCNKSVTYIFTALRGAGRITSAATGVTAGASVWTGPVALSLCRRMWQPA